MLQVDMLFHCSLGSFPEHKKRLNTDEGSNSFTETEPQWHHSEDTSMWKVSTPLFGNRMYESRCNVYTVSVDLLLIQHGCARYGHTGKQAWRKSWTPVSEDNFTSPKSTHTHSDTHTHYHSHTHANTPTLWQILPLHSKRGSEAESRRWSEEEGVRVTL